MVISHPSKLSGGGVGGLITAYALGRSNDIEVDVYESASQFAEVGAGIGVGWRAWCILQSLGLDQALSKYIAAPPSDGMGASISSFQSNILTLLFSRPSAIHTRLQV